MLFRSLSVCHPVCEFRCSGIPPPPDKYNLAPPHYHGWRGMSKPSATKYIVRINTLRRNVRPVAVCESLSFEPLEIKTVWWVVLRKSGVTERDKSNTCLRSSSWILASLRSPVMELVGLLFALRRRKRRKDEMMITITTGSSSRTDVVRSIRQKAFWGKTGVTHRHYTNSTNPFFLSFFWCYAYSSFLFFCEKHVYSKHIIHV